MAGLTCVYCRAENEPGEQLCRACFRKLPPEPTVLPPVAGPVVPSTPAVEPSVYSAPPAETPATCPHCGEDVPDPRNRVCVECHRPLAPAEPLRLSFSGGEVTVDPAQTVQLGRDPASSPVATVFADRGNISRLHATVGVDEGGAWVRDERSLNGTYVNDVPVPPGTRIDLSDGDTLRLAADVTATVRVIRPETR
ncbi:MAG: FHA domain-containing protein [Pseudonocardiaceae bacterium]